MEQAVLNSVVGFFRLCLWLLIIMMVFVPLERMLSLHPRKILRKAFFVDLLYYFINNLVPKLLLILPMAAVGWVIHRFIPAAYYERVDALPTAIRIAGALFIGELGFYWGHRWSHEIPFLWRFHAVHHSAEEMDWLVNTRVHPIDMVFTRLCGFVPLYFLGFAHPMASTLDTATLFIIFSSTLWGFFIHSNLKLRFGPLEWLLATPAFHHWHHTYDGPLDKNFSPLLPFFDLIFGTYHTPARQWPARYGTDTPISPDLSGQLIDPFLPSATLKADQDLQACNQ